MQSYLLTIAYDGARYAGWQRQDGFDTIQERLERALETVFGEPITVYGAGRTDAGVHALAQCAHVRLPREFAAERLLRALNGNLPRDIAVHAVAAVPAGFHARFAARGKRYLYRFAVCPVRPVLALGRCCWVARPLDLAAMRAGAAHIVGEKDFAAFASNPGYERKRGTVRRVDHLHLVRRPRGIDLVIQGNGFLYNMVRAIAGTLRDVGQRKIPPEAVGEIIASRDRRRAGMTAEACGLYLLRVLYPPAALGAGEPPPPRSAGG